MKVLLQFDKAINTALANRVKSRLTFKVRKNENKKLKRKKIHNK